MTTRHRRLHGPSRSASRLEKRGRHPRQPDPSAETFHPCSAWAAPKACIVQLSSYAFSSNWSKRLIHCNSSTRRRRNVTVQRKITLSELYLGQSLRLEVP